ncbi:MAG TPA: LLM class flavin-dependent oxidoreductase [Thermomicrobiaceae bacterium]|nr:LLM class flavin-dependent oxidoreductase [Thermomicrobiaceae bacterium]
MTLHYGLELPNVGADARTLAELAHEAEEMGWEGVFLEDYIVDPRDPAGPTVDPWVALTAMAITTSRIRLGCEVTPLPRRRPWKLVREAIALDYLSGGRVVLGIGLGDNGDDSFTHFGEELNTRARAAMVEEGLDIIRGLMTGQPFSYQGSYYQVDDVTFAPAPLQQPRIPIWIGGGWPRRSFVRRAAKCDGACPYYNTGSMEVWRDFTPEDVERFRAEIAEARGGEIDSFDVALGGNKRRPDVGEERAFRSALAEAGMTWYVEYAPGTIDEMRSVIRQGPVRIDG